MAAAGGPGPDHLLLHLEVGGALQVQEDVALASLHREARWQGSRSLAPAQAPLPQPGQGLGQTLG